MSNGLGKHVPPSTYRTAFNCPHCEVFTQQSWFNTAAKSLPGRQSPQVPTGTTLPVNLGSLAFHSATQVENIWLSRCFNCSNFIIWLNDRILHPQRREFPPANPDLPDDIRRDYDEAGSILDYSPRGAAALLRLAIQKLCIHLGQPGNSLKRDIGALVAGGLDRRTQRAFDSVRVIGNHAVHPGQLDLRDDRDTAEALLHLLNFIVEKTISEPKGTDERIDKIYSLVPKEEQQKIEERDAKNEN